MLKLGKRVDAFRSRDFATMSKADRRAYGDAVEKAIRAKQHREMFTAHRCRIDCASDQAKYAAAMAEKARRHDFAIPADCSIPGFLKRAA